MKCDESVAEARKTAVFHSLPRFEADRVVFGLIFMRPVFQEEALLLFNLILAGSSRNLKVLQCLSCQNFSEPFPQTT